MFGFDKDPDFFSFLARQFLRMPVCFGDGNTSQFILFEQQFNPNFLSALDHMHVYRFVIIAEKIEDETYVLKYFWHRATMLHPVFRSSNVPFPAAPGNPFRPFCLQLIFNRLLQRIVEFLYVILSNTLLAHQKRCIFSLK